MPMTETAHERCCGLDVHKDSITACLLTPRGKQVRTFGTTTGCLRQLVSWMQDAGCTHVAMESTGVYWKPIYNLLEETSMTVVVANPQKIKVIPGRKTDVKDAEWLATLMRRDMVPASLIPDRAQRELQELVRYRQSLVAEQARETNRIQKVLEGANIKLGSVLSDVQGISGRRMLEAMARGVQDADELAALADPKVKASRAELQAACESLIGPHQRMMLREQLAHLDDLAVRIARLDAEIEERMRPFEHQVAALDAIPGVGRVIAQEIIAFIGTDMSPFPSAQHLASWAKLCPGTHESAGKRSSARTGKGPKALRWTLVQAAHAAGRTRRTYLGARYHRLAGRIGSKKAAIAVAHDILIIAYHILRDGVAFEERGADYYTKRNPERVKRRALRQLEDLGFEVSLTLKAA
jgi:transposase